MIHSGYGCRCQSLEAISSIGIRTIQDWGSAQGWWHFPTLVILHPHIARMSKRIVPHEVRLTQETRVVRFSSGPSDSMCYFPTLRFHVCCGGLSLATYRSSKTWKSRKLELPFKRGLQSPEGSFCTHDELNTSLVQLHSLPVSKIMIMVICPRSSFACFTCPLQGI